MIPLSDVFNNSEIEISAADNQVHEFAAKSEMVWPTCIGDLPWNFPYISLADSILPQPKNIVSGSIDSITVLLIGIGVEPNLTLNLTQK